MSRTVACFIFYPVKSLQMRSQASASGVEARIALSWSFVSLLGLYSGVTAFCFSEAVKNSFRFAITERLRQRAQVLIDNASLEEVPNCTMPVGRKAKDVSRLRRKWSMM
eukprot:gnl/TRDRNA2_/TRDRNA2_157214_c1_seq1.p1 gnl/TRDRNA2_/TRDRNA2_157214_c1~~gnl/TRDRNA2_/TRDRNA2_157214_c1_seq1.p1  ORF type:complete len:120 (+),score=22.28 gnl/TRDRNA2_/TRDRNA2_157214_c1_seq1:36-362(+)